MLADPLRRVADAAELLRSVQCDEAQARAELHAAIIEADQAGKSLREIGRAAGISYTRVHQILRGE